MLEIDEIYDLNGLTIKCVEAQNGCRNCIFYEFPVECKRPSILEYQLCCTKVARPDNQSVIFIQA